MDLRLSLLRSLEVCWEATGRELAVLQAEVESTETWGVGLVGGFSEESARVGDFDEVAA